MRITLRVAICAIALAASSAAAMADVQFKYLYGLSDLNGPLRYLGGRIRTDAANEEVLFLEGNTVHILNAAAMETYEFTLDPELGRPFDVAVDPSGDFILPCVMPQIDGPFFVIQRCDYRGRLKATIVPKVPEGLRRFAPNTMELRDGHVLYFLSPMQLEMLVLDTDGSFDRLVDLAPLLDVEAGERGNLEIGGFGFDSEGDMIFTLPELFRAVEIGPDWKVRGGFGRKGSAPGRFGVVAGVVGDEQGNLYVADKGRSVVMMFDKDRRFVAEFGEYGDEPENLVRPEQLAWLPSGKLFVTQMRFRGVSVFDVASN